jgi:HSP20 family protein
MTNLTRWEPERGMMTLREAMDRLFDDAFTHPLDVARISDVPSIDMYQTDDEMVVKATIPGYEAEDVNISVEGDTVMIGGETKQKKEEKEATYYMREQRYGSFERSVRLPTAVKAEEAKAGFENGILTITFPLAEEERSKRIEIKVE